LQLAAGLLNRVARVFLVQTYQNGKNIPNDHKIYQTALNITKLPKNIPTGHKTYQHFPLQGPPNFTQIGIFGFKINHLATLLLNKEKKLSTCKSRRSSSGAGFRLPT
jgi:hypothetical protein